MSIALRIIGWTLMVLAAMLEVTNLMMLLTSPGWGLIAFVINTLFWAVLFIIGYALRTWGVNRKKEKQQELPQ